LPSSALATFIPLLQTNVAALKSARHRLSHRYTKARKS
jgi:hypothetical protein